MRGIISIFLVMLSVPVVCFVLFFRGLKKIKSYKKEMKTNPDEKLQNGIKNQTIVMVVTGSIGTVTGAAFLFAFIIFMLLATGAIPLM